MKTRMQKGFTVLEFLIVIAIMCILIYIALASLTSSREKSVDEKKITELKTVALGIEQFKQICGTYPAQIQPNQQCTGNDNLGTSTLNDFIPNIEAYRFNDPTSGFYYTPITYDPNNSDFCDGFHLGVELKNPVDGTVAVGDSNINSGDPMYQPCTATGATGATINGTDPRMFDIFK